MPFSLHPFANVGLDASLLEAKIADHSRRVVPRLRRFWEYYRNASDPRLGASASGRTRLAQEAGLPPRLVGRRPAAADDRDQSREIVIENDIAWRIHTMVDFMFGKPVLILSTARDPELRRLIERVLDAAFERSGGIGLFQDMALLAHVYGHVDLVLRAAGAPTSIDGPLSLASMLRVELIDPTRSIPVLSPGDYRELDAFIVHMAEGSAREPGWTEILSGDAWQAYSGGRLVDQSENTVTPGVLPVVHIQNISQPFRFEGLGEVEPLIPLQDELNTRLSDRANRVTLQNFKMYLARGIDGFERLPIGPGCVVSTDNPDASVVAFGGDAESPSEEAHVEQVREAMDKASGVPPLASGVVRAKIGNLTSANALKITLMGILAKTARKRVTYGRGIARMCELMLTALDHAGVLRTAPEDRGVTLSWPDPLPEDVEERVAAARVKRELGVSTERVLAELGYAPADAGVV